MQNNTISFYYENENQKISKEDFYQFHENLGRFYLDLAKGEHINFQVADNVVKNGSLVISEEESDGQRIKHAYHITIDHEKNKINWFSSNSEVFIKIWNLIPIKLMEVATLLSFEINPNKIKTQLTITFSSEKDLKFALTKKVDKIWETHHQREMTNAFAITKFLVNSNQIKNNPSLWNIDSIRGSLK